MPGVWCKWCECGHTDEDHGDACTLCDCVHFEWDGESGDDDDE